MTQSYIGTKQVLAWEQEKDGQPGYAVKYPDGFVSWSPKNVFEEAYLPIGNVDHLPAYQQRVIGEHAQLKSKVDKLVEFVNGDGFAKLAKEDQEQLAYQLVYMAAYQATLEVRMERFA